MRVLRYVLNSGYVSVTRACMVALESYTARIRAILAGQVSYECLFQCVTVQATGSPPECAGVRQDSATRQTEATAPQCERNIPSSSLLSSAQRIHRLRGIAGSASRISGCASRRQIIT